MPHKLSIKITLSLLAVIAVAVMIFFFSSQNALDSAALSNSLTHFFLERLAPGFSEMDAGGQQALLQQWQSVIRKVAHISEYALLSFTIIAYLHYVITNRRIISIVLIAWALATVYACTDEFHQIFISDRGPLVTDILIDSGGALVGVLMGAVVFWRRRGIRGIRGIR